MVFCNTRLNGADGRDPDPELYDAESFKNAPLKLRDFHDRVLQAEGLPRGLAVYGKPPITLGKKTHRMLTITSLLNLKAPSSCADLGGRGVEGNLISCPSVETASVETLRNLGVTITLTSTRQP